MLYRYFTLLLGLFSGAARSSNLSFALIASFGQYGTNSSGVIPAVDLALAEINSHPSVLQGYRLFYDQAKDSECLYAKSLQAFFSEIQNDPVKLAVIGCGCSVATQPVAAITSYWNIPQISYVDVSSALDDRTTYKSHFRTSPSDKHHYPVFYSIMNHFGWKRIGILTQNEDLFKLAELNIRGILETETVNYTVDSRTFETKSDPVASVHDLFLENDRQRIFFLNSYPGQARKILCQALKLGYTYPKYAWITNDWYNDKWWTAAENSAVVSCTDKQLEVFLEYALAIHSLPTVEDNSGATDTGRNPEEFISDYDAHCKQINCEKSEAAGRAYDAVWTLAFALNSTMTMVTSNSISGTGCENMPGSLVTLDQFNYTNQMMGCLIQWNIQRTNFSGVTGRVQFDENGTRIQHTISLKQYRIDASGALIRVPLAFFSVQNNYTWTFLPNYTDHAVYPDGTPSDGTPAQISRTYSIPMVVIIDILSTCGIVLVLICFLFNLLCRKRRVVRLSSVNLNYAILFGALLMYLSVYTYLVPTISPNPVKAMCVLKEWLFIIGYSLCFGTVLSRMWRIYKIFHNPTPKKKSLKDRHLLVIVSVIVFIGIGLVFLETAVPQLLGTVELDKDNEDSSGISANGVHVDYSLLVCYKASSLAFYWKILIFIYLAMLQIIGIMLAFQTRSVNLILVILAIDTFLLNTYLNAYAAIFSLGIIILTTTFLLFTFVPKMIQIYQNQETNSEPTVSTTTGRELGASSDQETYKTQASSLQERLQEREATIAALEKEITELKEEKLKLEMSFSKKMEEAAL
ncbi:hypothetical protein EMCRGX_G016732 [Ephydatia muelleri]